MTTLLSVYNSEGCVGRCDAKCYAAETPDCDCICRGRNHGVGLAKATDNARELAETWSDYAARLGGLRFDRVEVDATVANAPLF
jgi:hypothetical protein